jgi:two-component system, OmpR family, KDP operon response regulator KdpE
MTAPLVLLVEDDAPTRHALVQALHAHGFDVAEAPDVAGAIHAWQAHRPDLVILDLGLPDGDGLSVLHRVRAESSTPVLVLTARDAERDKVAALDAGADDHVTKPFGMAELHARVRALLRRAAGPAAGADGRVELGTLTVDVARHSVEVAGTPVRLTPRQFEVLKVLVAHAGRLVTHGRLLRAVWGRAYDDESHYLHVYVSQIRQKLADADPDGSLKGLIVAEPGVGYRVEVPSPRP